MVQSTLTPTTRLRTTEEYLVLRVCGSARHGQIVRLRSAKCTIGSGPTCTLRLRARGIGPVHCLILRGRERTVIRRWLPDTRLNGRAFDDAELSSGDRLSVGAIELEVVELGQLCDPLTRENRPTPAPSPSVPTRSDCGKPAASIARLTLAVRQGRQRARRLIEELRAAREEIARLQQPAEEPQQSGELCEAVAEFESQQEAFQDQRRQVEAELAEAEKRLTQRSEELDVAAAKLDAQQEALDEGRSQWNTQCAEAESRLEQRAAELDARRAELDALDEEIKQPPPRWETEHAAIEPEQIDPAAGYPQVPEVESSKAPVDLADGLGQMDNVDLLEDDEQSQESPAEPQPHSAPELSSSPLPPAADGDQGEEETIDDYMSRLLERVQTNTDNEKRQEGRPEPPPSFPQRAEPEPPTEELPLPQPASPRRQEPGKILPRAVAPEKATSLSAMREVANASAHSAINQHSRQETTHLKRAKLLMTGVGLSCSAALMWMWWSMGAESLAFYAALMGMVVCVFWAVQYAILTDRMVADRLSLPNFESDDEPADDQQPPTADAAEQQ